MVLPKCPHSPGDDDDTCTQYIVPLVMMIMGILLILSDDHMGWN